MDIRSMPRNTFSKEQVQIQNLILAEFDSAIKILEKTIPYGGGEFLLDAIDALREKRDEYAKWTLGMND